MGANYFAGQSQLGGHIGKPVSGRYQGTVKLAFAFIKTTLIGNRLDCQRLQRIARGADVVLRRKNGLPGFFQALAGDQPIGQQFGLLGQLFFQGSQQLITRSDGSALNRRLLDGRAASRWLLQSDFLRNAGLLFFKPLHIRADNFLLQLQHRLGHSANDLSLAHGLSCFEGFKLRHNAATQSHNVVGAPATDDDALARQGAGQ